MAPKFKLGHHPQFTNLDKSRHFCLYRRVNSSQFRRYLARHGCTFEEGKRHSLVYRDGKVAALPGTAAASSWALA